MPLLKKTVHINELTLDGVTINLLKDDMGNNWEFKPKFTGAITKPGKMRMVLTNIYLKNIKFNYTDQVNNYKITTKAFNILVNQNGHSIFSIKIKQAVSNLKGERQKKYSDITNVGGIVTVLKGKSGVVETEICKLYSTILDGMCNGNINLSNKTVNFVAQGRIIPVNGKTMINYIYFPYYLKGNFANLDSSIDWLYTMQQINIYSKDDRVKKPTLNKAMDVISELAIPYKIGVYKAGGNNI